MNLETRLNIALESPCWVCRRCFRHIKADRMGAKKYQIRPQSWREPDLFESTPFDDVAVWR